MRVVVEPDGVGAALTRTDEAGAALGPSWTVDDLAAEVAALEATEAPRWVWPSSARTYAVLLRAGVRVQRAHDLDLTQALLDVRAGRAPERARTDERLGLFDAGPAAPSAVARHTAQQQATADDPRLRLLVAAESAGGLAAAELSHDGLPFDVEHHRGVLARELGPRPSGDSAPQRLAELTTEIARAFRGRPVNPSSAAEVIAAFAIEGITVANTQARTVRELDHPAVPLLLRHAELARLHGANGWAWLDAWVHEGRFRPAWVPAASPSGRWGSRGGGALQIPRVLRASVVAEAGRTFVIADAGQLEPRILAAMSGDPAMVAVAGPGDLYAPVAQSFGGDRQRAKVAVLGVLYGATAGEARALLATLRRQYPVAVGLVEAAARAGEQGQVVHSHLGRACPPAPETFDPAARGRFTRNFVVQATAAEWALCWVAELRRRLAATGDAELVFFQHDEVVVHCADPEPVRAHVLAAAEVAGRLVFGDTAVTFPLEVAVRAVYAAP